MKQSKYAIIIASWVVFFAIVAVIWKVVANFNEYAFDKKVSPIELLTLLVATLFSSVLLLYFERRKHSDQLHKASAIDRLRISFDNLRDLRRLCASGEFGFTEVVKQIKECRTEINAFAEFATSLGFKDCEENARKVSDECGNVSSILTNTPVDPSGKPGIRKSGNTVWVDPSLLLQAESCINDAMRCLYALQVGIIDAI